MTLQPSHHADFLGAPSSRLDAVQAIRGIAALLVAFGHAASQVSASSAGAGGGQAFWIMRHLNPDYAQIGVDLFFVISGFIMVFTTHGRGMSPLEFLRRRGLRIYPLYWFVCLLALALHSSRYLPRLEGDLATFLKSFALYPVYWHDLALLRPAMVPQGWTLTFEILFYLVFAATMRLRPWVQFASIVGLFALTLGFTADRSDPRPAELALLGDPLLFEFPLGMLLGMLYCRWRAFLNPTLSWIFVAVALGLVPSLWRTPAPRLLQLGLPAFLIVAALVLGRGMEALRFPRWLLAAGDASYSIYLSHGLVLTLFHAGFVRLPALQALPPDLCYPLLLVAITVVGVLTHRWVEQPLLALFRKRPAAPVK